MNLDGVGVVPLVTSGVRCPSSLRLDIPRRVLYWVDQQLGVISSLTLDGSHRRVSSVSISDCVTLRYTIRTYLTYTDKFIISGYTKREVDVDPPYMLWHFCRPMYVWPPSLRYTLVDCMTKLL